MDWMTGDFDPAAAHDNYLEALQEVGDAKVEGREVIQPEGVIEATEPTSLADALKASLAAARRPQAQAGEIKTEVKGGQRRAIADGTKTRATAGAADTARGGRARTAGANGRRGEGETPGPPAAQRTRRTAQATR